MEARISDAVERNKRVDWQLTQIAVVSGKGGTGKTTLAGSFAVLAQDTVIADCDVDAATLHLLLHPQVIETQEFKGSKLAIIDKAKCIDCNLCRDACRFDAISNDLQIDPFLCEGCGVCAVVCPERAVILQERIAGYAFISKTKYGPMSHARLNPGEANSGKLVTLVRHNAKQIGEKEKHSLILIDGSPGIGCPVIASISGVDVGLVVTEPTMSGIHDLKRALELLNHFKVTPFVCINMYDINKTNAQRIVKFCDRNEVEVAGTIPFDPIVTEAIVAGKTVIEYSPDSAVSKEIGNVWKKIHTVSTSR